MAGKTTIEWATDSWNPVRGCAIVSKGCTNCYAMRQAHRSSGPGGAYEGLTKLTKGGPVWTGEIRLVRELLGQPLAWKRPRRIFVNSMSDLFHEDVPDEFLVHVFDVMVRAKRHVFQILTKRPQRMVDFLCGTSGAGAGNSEFFPNIWLGVSVEDQASADERIPLLLQAPAGVRWISAEPLLGALELQRYLGNPLTTPYPFLVPVTAPAPRGIDWVVVGGESGPGARPMHPAWARSLRNQCAAAGVAFFFKQWGSWVSLSEVGGPGQHHYFDDGSGVRRTGKKLAGRTLDGRTHDEYPA